MFFNGWNELIRIVTVGTLAYFALIAIVRISGKRTLAKLNAFDLVVTVALGSTLATVLLSRDLSLAGGVVALGLLVFLQFAVAWTSVRSPAIRRLVRAEPSLVVHRGVFLRGAMRAMRVTEDEILAVLRDSGRASVHDVDAVILETDGSFAVLSQAGAGSQVLQNMRRDRN